jgi:hypothetical protein
MTDWWNDDSQQRALESVTIFGVPVKCGDRVRVWPGKNADILDTVLKGQVAIVEAIERDFDDHLHLALVFENDPGLDFGMLRQPGHRFFFSPDEVEPITVNGELSSEK